ncbi:hypothetical protein BDZ97DRAFT_1929168 [Flammula alnicola]|nr:hypothetical protein BDZ97DRAFT_1929168 [Flammula alnicola]
MLNARMTSPAKHYCQECCGGSATGVRQQPPTVQHGGDWSYYHTGDVITMMDSEGALVGWAGTGGWMVFEVMQDFGMERPIRSYELLADVQSSWLKDKTVNYFILKLTLWCSSRSMAYEILT